MQNPISYAERSFTLAAGATLKYDRQATFIDCLESSSSFKIKLDNSPESDFAAGLQFEPIGGFSTVELRNPNATALTVTLGFGIGNMRDNRVTLNAGQTLPVRQGAPDVFTSYGRIDVGTGPTLLSAANPLKNEVILNPTSNVYIGDATVNNLTGYLLTSGVTAVIKTSAALYGYTGIASGTYYVWVAETAWSS